MKKFWLETRDETDQPDGRDALASSSFEKVDLATMCRSRHHLTHPRHPPCGAEPRLWGEKN
jgi:hypothetical protein